MIFARYIGPDIAGGGHFIPGKVYFGTPEMEDADVVGLDFVNINDETGQAIRVVPSEDRFEFLNEVYAVALEPFDEYEPGDVMILDEGQINGEIFVRVKGLGYRKASSVEVLDRTNVYPGVVVLDVPTGIWKHVMRVDECLWMTLEGQDIMRTPTEFKFAVSHDGELMCVPVVTCIDNSGMPDLTKGKAYFLKSIANDDFCVMNDKGAENSYFSSRFQMG
jgi:hypothetical protein